jgi:hypothetical protein
MTNSKFKPTEFPRKNETQKAPHAVTFEIEQSFSLLSNELQQKVKRKEITLDQACNEMFAKYENAYSAIIPENTRKSINSLAWKIIQQNEHSREIFGKMNKAEMQHFYNALAIHFTNTRLTENRKYLEAEKNEEGEFLDLPTINNLHWSINTILRLEREFLNQNYTIENLHNKAKALEEKEKARGLAKKYARDLTIFYESSLSGIGTSKIHYSTETHDKKLEQDLFEIFANSNSGKWHEKCLEKAETDKEFENDFQKILVKIKAFQDAENEERKKNGKKPEPGYNGEINDSFLSILNPNRKPEKIGNMFEVEGEKFQIWELFTKTQLEEESESLDHCVGEGNTYFQAIRDGEIRIFSLRDKNGKPKYTLEYNIKNKSIVQFKDGEDELILIPEKSELPMQTFTSLSNAGVSIEMVKEAFDYSIISEKGIFKKVEKLDKNRILKLFQNKENIVIKADTLRLNENTTKEELDILTQMKGLTLNLTSIKPELKNTIARVAGDLIDYSETVAYNALTSIGGYAHFESLRSAKGLSSLTSIGGYANFWSLKNAEGLNALTSIGGDANFPNLTNAEGLEEMRILQI